MSDAYKPLQVTVTARAVLKDVDDLYHVFEWDGDYGWRQVTRGYKHSTSCYAQLGRMTNKEHQQAVMELQRANLQQ